MHNWLYFIESNKEYHKLMTFCHDDEDVNGTSYLIFEEDVSCRTGKIFRTHNNLLIAVNFFTYKRKNDPREKIINSGLETDFLVNYYDLTLGALDLKSHVETVNKLAKRIIFESDLIKFLDGLHFKFKNGSSLTMPDSMALKEAFRHFLLKPDSKALKEDFKRLLLERDRLKGESL